MRRRAARATGAAAAVIASLLMFAQGSYAAVINVNTTADLPAPGCTEVSGPCSLRQALTLANGNADPTNTVIVPPSIVSYELPNGVLTISKSLTLQGGGSGGTTITGSAANRVLIITGTSAVSVAINGVTITGGFVTSSAGLVGGAGIRDESGGPLSLTGTVITGNSATANGGNCCNGGAGVWTEGAVTLQDSSINHNTASITAGAFCCDGGGGLYEDGGDITLVNSSISDNSVTVTGGTGNEGGGGFYQDGGNITLTNSSVNDNTFTLREAAGNDGGGGFYEDGGVITLTNSAVEGNRAILTETTDFDGGGGFYQDGGETFLSQASVSGNAFMQSGAAGSSGNGGGGLFNDGGELSISRSTVGANTAEVVGTEFNGGGGIYHDGGALTMADSTLSANKLNVTGTTGNGGGGIFINSGESQWASDTIAANMANVPGGGLFSNSPTVGKLLNSIVADNTAPSGINCMPSAKFASLGHNIESAATCNLGAEGDLKNTEPLLGPLQNNGGPAFTQMPGAGSPAIDAGNSAMCPPDDERGEARPQGAGCDIGAVEVAPPLATTGPASAVSNTVATLSGAGTNPDTVAGGNGYFQLGKTTAYETQTSPVPLAAGASNVAFSVAQGSLTPGTLYHYRAVVATPDGISFGADRTFTTAGQPSVRPTVTGLSQTHRVWRAGDKQAQISRRRKQPPVGTTFSFRLNERASVSFSFTQTVGGRRVGRRCVPPTKHNRHRRTCKRTATVATLVLSGHAGSDRVSFQGRVSRARKLEPGRYTLVVTATDSAGRKSAPQRLSFVIAR